MKKEFKYKEVCFREGTPEKLAEILIQLRANRTRIVLDLGDTTTGQSWGEVYDVAGRIGKSTGPEPILILVHNARSMGGGAILTNCILSIKESKGKRLIYQHEKKI